MSETGPGPMSGPTPEEEAMNNVLAAGAVLGVLWLGLDGSELLSAEPVHVDGAATNVIEVQFSFLGSPYRLTVERVPDPPHGSEAGL